MRIKLPFNIVLGITTEIIYTFAIMLAAFLICLALSFIKL